MMKPSTDTVPAMLTPGEFVIRKDAAEEIGPENLEMLNNIDRLSQSALIENARSPMGYQEGGFISNLMGDTGEKYSDLKNLFGSKQRFSDLSEDDFKQTTGQLFEELKARRAAEKLFSETPSLQSSPGLSMRNDGREEQTFLKSDANYTPTEQAYLKSLPAMEEIAKKYEILSTDQAELSPRIAKQSLAELSPKEIKTLESLFGSTEEAYGKSMPAMEGIATKYGILGTSAPELEMRQDSSFNIPSSLSAMQNPGRPDIEREQMSNLAEALNEEMVLSEMPEMMGGVSNFAEPSPEPSVYFDDLPMWEKLGMLMMGEDKFDNMRGKSRRIMSGKEFQGGEVSGVPQDMNFLKAIGMQEGGKVMNYKGGGKVEEFMSMFGDKSQESDKIQELAALASMQNMVGMYGGGYVKKYQDGGPVDPPMPQGQLEPQQVPMSGAQQAYYKTPMEQLGMDEYEYSSYLKYGPDMFRWMAQKYKPKTEWTVYDSLVDAGKIDPYEVSKDSINVLTDEQLNELTEKSGIRQ